MTTLVVGASGATGRLLVEQLLKRGLNVKVVVRSPAKLPDALRNHDALSVIEASLLDLSDAELAQHVNGCVAIATALVPPLCSAGISLAYDRIDDALGAGSLLAANVIAIILSAALTFRMMGLLGTGGSGTRQLWVRRVVVALAVCAVVIALPLASAFIRQVHEGKVQPIAFPVTNEVKNAVNAYIEKDPGRTLILIGRPGIESEGQRIDVGIILSSETPLPRAFADELAEIVREKMENPDAIVRVACVAAHWAEPAASVGSDPETIVPPMPDPEDEPEEAAEPEATPES